MRESRFILQNKEKWKRYEDGIKSGSLPPEEMESAFVELNDDLAYARTFYKNRAVRLFLNNLLAPVYTAIYKGKKWNLKNAGIFFSEEAPKMNYAARYFMLVSFITVLLGVCIGYFSTRYNSDFASTILGAEYVHITENNISKGDPLAIYKYQEPGDMFVAIALNNLIVAARFFFFGALFCIGTMYLLLFNGIVLGAFTWMFTSKGLTTEYLLTVYQHGTLEILGMVVEGAAGIMIGAGILFPGSLSRAKSMQIAAKKSVVIFLICVPVIIVAAFIESYLTRFTEINNVLRLLIILFSFLIMLYYFVIYPFWKFRKYQWADSGEIKLETDSGTDPAPGEIYKNSSIVLYVFDFIKSNAFRVLLLGLVSLFCMFFVVDAWSNHAITKDLQSQLNAWLQRRNGIGVSSGVQFTTEARMFFFNIYAACYFFSHRVSYVATFFSWCAISGIVFYVLYLNREFISRCCYRQIPLVRMMVAAVLCGSLQIALNVLFGKLWPLSMLLVFPLQLIFAVFYCMSESYNPVETGVNTIVFLVGSMVKFLGAVLICGILYFVIMFGLYFLIMQGINITAHFHGTDELTMGILKFFVGMNYVFIPFFIFLYVRYFSLTAATMYEAHTGTSLKKKIESLSFKREIYGIETE